MEADEEPVARVFDSYLYPSDLDEMPMLNEAGNEHLKKAFIEKWAKEQLVKSTAEDKIVDQAKINRLVEDYRASLLVQVYEQRFIQQQLDSTITDVDLEAIYEKYKEDFIQEESIASVTYAVFKRGNKNTDSVRALMEVMDDPAAKIKMFQICKEHSMSFALEEENWLPNKKIYKKIPFLKGSFNYYLKKEKVNIYYQDDEATVFFIHGSIDKGEMAPLTTIKPDLEKILLNNRKLKLIKEFKEELYQEEFKKKNIEIFKDE